MSYIIHGIWHLCLQTLDYPIEQDELNVNKDKFESIYPALTERLH